MILGSYKRFVYAILYVFTHAFGYAQDVHTPFSEVYEKSLSINDTLNLASDDRPSVEQLFAKEVWLVSELEVIDRIIRLNDSANPNVKGLFYYVAGNAYNDFDTELKIDFFRNAYTSFRQADDVEGMFFSLLEIFNAKVSSADSDSNEHVFDKSYSELSNLADESEYIPVHIALKESYVRKTIKLNQRIADEALDDMTTFAQTHVDKYTKLVRKLFTVIGIAHQKNGSFENAMLYKQKALALANPNKRDYPSYLLNVGASYFFNRDFDSALHYIGRAYRIMPEETPNVYQAQLKRTITYNLSMVYKLTNNIDSAFYFLQESSRFSVLLMNLKLDQNSIYAEKKFELQKTEWKLANKEFLLTKERQMRNILIGVVCLSAFVVGFLIFAYRKRKRLEQEATRLKERREWLLRIVSHDLGEPLQVFSYSSVIIPKLIANEKFDELTQVQHSLADTIISLQTILKNLFHWNEHVSSTSKSSVTEINVNEDVNHIMTSYAGIAEIKALNMALHMDDGILIRCHGLEFGNLLRNLIYNAIKHSNPNNSIIIHVNIKDEEGLLVTISNHIQPGAKQKVEELVEHYSGRRNLNRSKGGLGIELIDEALVVLNAQIKAQLEGDTLNIMLLIPSTDLTQKNQSL